LVRLYHHERILEIRQKENKLVACLLKATLGTLWSDNTLLKKLNYNLVAAPASSGSDLPTR